MILDFNEYFEKIEAVLQNALSEEPAFLAGPVKDMVNRGGKRWRPLLSLLVCEGLGGGEAVLPLLPLVELSHTASLIHDDIEDHSPLRRGKPSCHILYGEDAAINAGSFLYFHASACIDTWPGAAEKKARVFSLWSRYMRRLHTGQAFDIYWHNNFVIPCVDDYLRMCAMKTGCLAEFAAALAETLARETPAKESGETALLLQAASDMGVGFQIMDDVKNLRGGIAGKKRGDDIIEGKKSLPIILFLADKGEAERRFVENAFHAARAEGVDSPAVETCITALEQDGAIARAEQQGQNLLNEAFTALRDYPWTAREAMRTAWNVFRTRIGGGAGTGQ